MNPLTFCPSQQPRERRREKKKVIVGFSESTGFLISFILVKIFFFQNVENGGFVLVIDRPPQSKKNKKNFCHSPRNHIFYVNSMLFVFSSLCKTQESCYYKRSHGYILRNFYPRSDFVLLV